MADYKFHKDPLTGVQYVRRNVEVTYSDNTKGIVGTNIPLTGNDTEDFTIYEEWAKTNTTEEADPAD